MAVTHNSSHILASLLNSLPLSIPLVVVDNLSTDASVAVVEDLRPDAHILRNSVNVGYGRGVNTGLAVVDTEFVLITSPDIVIEPGSIGQLLSSADEFPDAAMVAPKILNPDGSVELSHDVSLHKRSSRGHRSKEALPEGLLCADFLSGASWLARMSMLRDVGFFDSSIFLYYEDDDLCQRIRNAGHSLLVDPQAVFTHVSGGSVPATTAYVWRKYWHMSWSRLYFERKHRGWCSMLKVFLSHAPVYGIKALIYTLAGKRTKSSRDAARFAGMFAAVRGVSAFETIQ